MSGELWVWRRFCLAAVILSALSAPGADSSWAGRSASGETSRSRLITRDFFGANGVSFLHYRDSPDATSTAERRINLIREIGASTDRGDLWWSVVEPRPGEWDWKATDWLFDFFQRNGIGLLPILAYHEAGANHSPATDTDRARFAEYARRTVERYKDREVAVGWEVWNEPNIPTFWKPQPDVADYVALLKETYRAVKAADPQTTVVGGAINMTDVNFLEEMAKLGALDYMDVLSIHPYTLADGPEEMHLQRQLQNYRAVLARHGKGAMPVWITEMGWQSRPDMPETVAKAAAYLVQSHVIAAAEGIERLFWFNVQDWVEGAHREAWGFLTPDGVTKPTADAYRTSVRHLTGARFEGYLNLPGAGVFVFSTPEDRQTSPGLRGAGSLAVAWALRQAPGAEAPRLPVAVAKLELPMTEETLRRLQPPVITSVSGEPLPATASHLALTTEPVYVRLQGDNLFTGLEPRRPEPENLVVNGSLELRDEGTTTPYGWAMGLFYGGQNSGRYGVQNGAVTLSDTKHAVWQSWPMPCLPGERFRAAARMKAEKATGQNGIQLQFFTGPGWGLAEAPEVATVTGTTEEWTTVSVTGTCPPGADWVRVNLLSRENRGTVTFDDVELRRHR